jgi:GntR family transcriptional regulator/MocR family aminotransferase
LLALTLAPNAPTLHHALYDALRGAILDGRLRSGTRLPSSRALGAELGVARGTVVGVFEQLAGEGYVTSRRGSGTVVAAELPDRWFRAAESDERAPSAVGPRLHLHTPVGSPFATRARPPARPFRAHVPAVDEFPMAIWTNLVARHARREAMFLDDGDAAGHRPLRRVLADYLRTARGVRCREENVVIASGAQPLLTCLAHVLLERGSIVAMEDPGYDGARAVFREHGAAIAPVPVDACGLQVSRLPRRARLVYVTPGHQAPLGVTMSAERRLALLAWAARHDAYVLEDDYDGEFRYEGWPVAALQSLDRAGVVLHIGAFSKTMLPSLRLAYAVLPDAVVEPYLVTKALFDRFTPTLFQAALTDFVEAGHFERHLRRMRLLYAERRAALVSALDGLDVIGANAGIDLALHLSKPDTAVVARLSEANIEAAALSRSALEAPQNGLVLGFAAFSPPRLRRAAERLKRIVG